MKITQLSKSESEVISENDNLARYLENLDTQVPHTQRSWLYESETPEKVLEKWMDHLDVLRTGNTFERNVYHFDTSQLEKWGPQGGHPPISKVLKEVVLPTFEIADSPRRLVFPSKDWKKAVEHIVWDYNRKGLYSMRPASYPIVIDDMRARDTLESNSGWPYFTRRNMPNVKHNALVQAERGLWEQYPAIALFRNYNKKLRLVWMFPMATNVVEGSFVQPVQSSIMTRSSSFPFYAPWRGFEHVRALITDAYNRGKVIAASDFSSTDAHFTWECTEQVFAVLQRLFQQTYTRQLYASLNNMQTIPLIIGPDSKIVGGHGVASGSTWTNFVETVFDHIFSIYVAMHSKYQYRGLYAIGDDMAWVSDKYDEGFSSELEKLGKGVGQIIKAEKTTNDPDKVKSLQRLFQRGYNRRDGMIRGVYSTVRALKSSVYPEKMHKAKLWDSDMFCARQYMILENCVDHPLFEDFVKFVVHGQKDLIPFAKKGKRELVNITRKTKLLPGFNPTYNQEKRDSSLENFESIRIARKL